MTAALDFSTPHLIRSEREYDVVVAEIHRLLDKHPPEGSALEERIEFLSLLVEDFDRKHFGVIGGAVTPPQVVEFMLEQRGMRRADLATVMGGRARVSQFFSGKRALSMRQLRALRALLGIPADLLIPGPVEPAAGRTRKSGRHVTLPRRARAKSTR